MIIGRAQGVRRERVHEGRGEEDHDGERWGMRMRREELREKMIGKQVGEKG